MTPTICGPLSGVAGATLTFTVSGLSAAPKDDDLSITIDDVPVVGHYTWDNDTQVLIIKIDTQAGNQFLDLSVDDPTNSTSATTAVILG